MPSVVDTMAAQPHSGPKRNYRCVPALQQFYSGGPYAVSSDAAFLACACGDRIKIVDASTAAVKSTLGDEINDSDDVTAIAIAPGDRLLFSAGHSRLIRVWDLESSKCIRSWKGHDGPVMGMTCHASGGLLATAGADKKVCVWDVDGGFCTHFFKGHEGVVTSIIFHSDPSRLLLFSGSDDATVRIWNLESKKCIAVLEKHFSPVTSLAISEDGKTLLSAARDKVVNVWDLQSYGLKVTVPTYEMVESICIIMSTTSTFASLCPSRKNGTGSPIYFLTVGERGIVRIWSSEGAVCIYEQQSSDATISSDNDESRRGFISALILPSDQGLLCVTADQQFLFYRLEKLSQGSLQLSLFKRLVGYNEEILDMKFLGAEEKYLAVATNLEQVRVYDLTTMSCSYVLEGHTDIVVCLDSCLLKSGRKLLVTGSKDNSVRLWEVQDRKCIGVGKGHMGAVGAVAFSKKFKNFFVSASSDRTVKVWSCSDLSEDPHGEIALKSRAVVAAHDKDINCLAVAPDDSYVCSGSADRTACLWRLPDLVAAVKLTGHKRGIWSVEFSPVDPCVMTSSGDGTIKIWTVCDGSCLRTFQGHTSSVLRAAFLTRGTQLISCGGDGLVKLWTVKSSECIATYDHHAGKVWALAVGSKTEMLATGGTDGLVNLWYDATAAEKEEAFRKEEEAILRGQELENAVSDADYTKAIQLAFELRRPHRLFELFSNLMRRRDAVDPIKNALRGLGREQLRVLLEYVREWNTKPKICHVAQFVLHQLFKLFPPNELTEVKGISELLEGLMPYSQRHFSRIDRLVRSTFLMDYILSEMSVIEPQSGLLTPKDEPLVSTDDRGQAQHIASEDLMRADNAVSENIEVQQSISLEQNEMISSRKRKSSKSKRSSDKKAKLGAQKDSSGVSLQT